MGLTDRQREELARYASDAHAMLSAMTVKQLRTYANQNHIPMGGASAKAELIQEMVGQMRHRRWLEMTGEGRRTA